jgi:hypothetical protein
MALAGVGLQQVHLAQGVEEEEHVAQLAERRHRAVHRQACLAVDVALVEPLARLHRLLADGHRAALERIQHGPRAQADVGRAIVLERRKGGRDGLDGR